MFCSQCGKPVAATDKFCAGCGASQPAAPAAPKPDPLHSISPRVAAILCYIPMVGWIASIVVLATDRFRNDHKLRFHAFQGLYLFVAWLIIDQVIAPFFRHVPGMPIPIDKLLHASVIATWIFMIVKAAHEKVYSLPIIGELAEKSASES
ncbi:MAG: zinc-ribbon domain-containing protein [Bryobacteraceae bacterium]